jgi:hypothetical protein
MMIVPMPEMNVTAYTVIRPELRPGDVLFFSQDTSGFKKITQFVSWRIKCDQTPPLDCTHVGMVDVIRGRRVLVEATAPCVRVGPISAMLGLIQDGKYTHAPYDGSVYVGRFSGCDGEKAASDAWENLLLGYDYLDLLAIRLGLRRSEKSRYICSELVAEALEAGGALLPDPAAAGAYTPADLVLAPGCRMLWRLR